MPDGTWIEVSGDGEALVDGGTLHQMTEMVAVLGTYTSPRIRIANGGDPKRVTYGGSAGFGSTDTDHLGSTVTIYQHGFQLEFERVFYLVPWSVYAQYPIWDRMWWKIPPGINWWIRPSWA